MSYSEKKITQAEVDARNVKSAPDVLVGNAGDNKQVFDSLPEYIVEKYNSLMDDLDGTQGDIDADISSIESDIDAINETLATKADNVDFAGATATQAGEHGLVPPLAAGNRKHVLFGSGQWHQLDIDAWQNNSSVNVGLTTDKSTSGTYIRYSTASIPVATPTQPGAMSATDKGKLDNIAEGAEVNVQSDWNDTDTSSDAYIKNKPTIDAILDPDSENAVQNKAIVAVLDEKADEEHTESMFSQINSALAGKVDKVSGKGLSTNDYTTAEKNKLAGIATGAEVNVQPDWNQANTSADDYIKNKPTIVTPADLNTAITAEQTAREQADSEIETTVLNAYINKTASGAIATFTDGAEMPAKSVIVNIEPQQSGTGTPSPDNVRPISGWESVNVYVSPTEDEADGHTTPVNLGRTVYGGTLDVVTGVLTVDKGFATFDGSSDEIWFNNGSVGVYTPKASLPNVKANAGMLSNQYIRIGAGEAPRKNGQFCWNANYTALQFRNDNALRATDFRAALAQNPVTIVYPLETPQTYQLTPTEIQTLLGENNVWADSGDVEVVYRADPTLAYQELANAITALGGNV